MPSDPAESSFRQVLAWLKAMPGAAVLEMTSRIGYAARGVVYLSIGVAALLAAVELTPTAEGAAGAMQAWGSWPAGMLLLLLVGWGLMGFAAWRALQAVFDADGRGSDAHALAVRAGQAISGIVHGVLAMSVFELADGLETLGEADEEGAARETAASVLELPGGDWLLLGGGLFILAVGLANMAEGLFQDVAKRLNCPPDARGWIVALGRIGHVGRGVALTALGLLIAKAGLDARSGEARSLGGALQMLERQPMGSWVLSLTAIGLIAFGLFALAEARYRRMRVPKAAS